MLTSTSRLLRLLSLLQTPRDWTGRQLAEALGVTPRTIRKDVERLRELGYPIDGLPGATGGYRLGAGRELPPLLLDDEEAVAVAIALHAATTGSVAGIEEISLRALTKITSLLPTRLRRGVQTVQRTSVMLPARGPRVSADQLQALAVAIRGSEGVRFDYVGADGTATRRRVEPYQLVHRSARWYLLGYDLERDDWRSFRVDRLTLRTPGERRFRPRPIPGGDAGAYVERSLDAVEDRHVAVIRVHASLGEVSPWWDPDWGTLEPIDHDHVRFTTRAATLDDLAWGLARSGLEFDVVEPVALRDLVAEIGARFSRATGRGRAGG